MENTEIKTFDDIKRTGPYTNDEIYLEAIDTHQVLAVCATSAIAKLIANELNLSYCFSNENLQLNACTEISGNVKNELSATNSTSEKSAAKAVVRVYADLIKSAYYLDIAIQKAKIPVDNINTLLLEKAYAEFKHYLDILVEKEQLILKDDNDSTPEVSSMPN